MAQGKWTEFDQERALLQEARAKGAPGLSAKDADIIDVLYVCPSPCDAKVQDKGTEQYRVIGYAELTGQYKMKYNFVHYGTDGKPDRWIACESEDVDQGFLAQRHPKEAAAGKRSYSLDSYTAPAANGKGGVTVQHGTIKFYHDGEPTYQTVRADVLAEENKIKPISQSQSTVPEGKPKQKQ